MGFINDFQGMTSEERDRVIDNMIADSKYQIVEDGNFCDCFAGTNATGWDIDEYEYDIENANVYEDEIQLPMTYHASGDQEEEKMFYGDEITGEALAVIDDAGKVRYEDVTAEVASE